MATTYTASPKAIAYAQSLTTQTWNGSPELLAATLKTIETMAPKQVSNIIDILKPVAYAAKFQAAKITVTTDLPAGRYAVQGLDGTVMRYQIDKPENGKWAGWTFVRDLDTKEPIKDRDHKQAILDELAEAGYLESAKLYGKTTGECGICHKTLTNPESIAAGIGPICAQKF